MKLLNGFRDFYPQECAKRSYIMSVWQDAAHRYGFTQYDGPPLESLELFTKKSGDEIVGQLYNFTDKGKREVALRPEMTPTFARMISARHRDYKKPIKWFSTPQVFRYERPQKGRLREHYQFNCDIAGETDTESDVELIALCIDTLRGFGFTSDDFVVRISDRQFWIDFLQQHNVPEADWYGILQAIDKSERQAEEKTRTQLGKLADPVLEILKNGTESERISTVLNGLSARGLGDFAKQDMTIVRGLAYYTGIVFEVFDRKGENRAIAAGGRYDTLMANLCNVDLPALGFGMGDVVLGNMIDETPAASEKLEKFVSQYLSSDIYLVIADEDQRQNAMQLLQDLRDAGHKTLYPLTPAKVGKQFQAAEQNGCHTAVVIGSEWPMVNLKTLATREESQINSTDLLDSLSTKSEH